MTKQYQIEPDTIGLCQIDEINFIVFRKQKMIDNTYTYKVQSYNSQTDSYGLSDYELSFEQALAKFFFRTCRLINKHTFRFKEQPINEDRGLDEHFENKTSLDYLQELNENNDLFPSNV